jgi:hypothetical protein
VTEPEKTSDQFSWDDIDIPTNGDGETTDHLPRRRRSLVFKNVFLRSKDMAETKNQVFERDVNLTIQEWHNLAVQKACFAILADGKTLLQYTLDESREDQWTEAERLEYCGPDDPLCTEILAWALVTCDISVIPFPLVQTGWDSENDRPIVSSHPAYWKTNKPDVEDQLNIFRPLSIGATTVRTEGGI